MKISQRTQFEYDHSQSMISFCFVLSQSSDFTRESYRFCHLSKEFIQAYIQVKLRENRKKISLHFLSRSEIPVETTCHSSLLKASCIRWCPEAKSTIHLENLFDSKIRASPRFSSFFSSRRKSFPSFSTSEDSGFYIEKFSLKFDAKNEDSSICHVRFSVHRSEIIVFLCKNRRGIVSSR